MGFQCAWPVYPLGRSSSNKSLTLTLSAAAMVARVFNVQAPIRASRALLIVSVAKLVSSAIFMMVRPLSSINAFNVLFIMLTSC